MSPARPPEGANSLLEGQGRRRNGAPVIAGTLLEAALRRDRLLVVAGLLFVVVLSWAWLLAGAGMMDMGDALMPMSTPPWTPGHASIVLVMWAVMMAAMMLPSAAPTILLHATIARRRRERSALSALFVCGYLVVWSAFSVAATALQFALERAALMSPAMQTTSIALAGTVLVGAGLYQWTPLKQACLRHCRSPLHFIMTQWRPGAAGAFSMGLRHGSYCLGCCWLLMLLLFVGGVMNFVWIAGIALFVLVEKFVPAGHWVSRGAGVLLVGWGRRPCSPPKRSTTWRNYSLISASPVPASMHRCKYDGDSTSITSSVGRTCASIRCPPHVDELVLHGPPFTPRWPRPLVLTPTTRSLPFLQHCPVALRSGNAGARVARGFAGQRLENDSISGKLHRPPAR